MFSIPVGKFRVGELIVPRSFVDVLFDSVSKKDVHQWRLCFKGIAHAVENDSIISAEGDRFVSLITM